MKQFLKEMVTIDADNDMDFIKLLLMLFSIIAVTATASIYVGVYLTPLLIPVVFLVVWALMTYLTMKK